MRGAQGECISFVVGIVGRKSEREEERTGTVHILESPILAASLRIALLASSALLRDGSKRRKKARCSVRTLCDELMMKVVRIQAALGGRRSECAESEVNQAGTLSRSCSARSRQVCSNSNKY